MADLTHDNLVALAARWLRSTRKCSLVATERMAPTANEAPDAIGWRWDGFSVLVECKTSLGDFYADRRKPTRRGLLPAMGQERWYLTPPGLLTGRDLPVGWGWAVVQHGRVYRLTPSVPRPADPEMLAAERPLLLAIARRALQGIAAGVALEGLPVVLAEPGHQLQIEIATSEEVAHGT